MGMRAGFWEPARSTQGAPGVGRRRICEIRHGKHNAVTVSGKNLVIASCKIHQVLTGTFADQKDAHGITGNPDGLTIRNCDIGLVSGDALQFDPGRRPWDRVVVENCTLWTGPLENDAAGFQRGQRPGKMLSIRNSTRAIHVAG